MREFLTKVLYSFGSTNLAHHLIYHCWLHNYFLILSGAPPPPDCLQFSVNDTFCCVISWKLNLETRCSLGISLLLHQNIVQWIYLNNNSQKSTYIKNKCTHSCKSSSWERNGVIHQCGKSLLLEMKQVTGKTMAFKFCTVFHYTWNKSRLTKCMYVSFDESLFEIATLRKISVELKRNNID